MYHPVGGKLACIKEVKEMDTMSTTSVDVVPDHNDVRGIAVDFRPVETVDDLFLKVLIWLKEKKYVMGTNMSCTGLEGDRITFTLHYTTLLSKKKMTLKLILLDHANVNVQVCDSDAKPMAAMPPSKMSWYILAPRMESYSPYAPSE